MTVIIGKESEALLFKECNDFLVHEADLLDNWKLNEWLDGLTKDIDYQIPVRLAKERAKGTGFSRDAFTMHDDLVSLEARIKRLQSEYAWSENMPSRSRRFVTNVALINANSPDEINVKSYVLFFRSQGDSATYDFLSAERKDTLRRVDGALKLAKRVVLLDHTILPLNTLSLFL